MDADGNDNMPEWGYCEVPGCSEPALPLWYSGGFPDDADMKLCVDHIGKRMGALEEALRTAQEDTCSLHCPSVWKTSEGQPLHSDRCKAISAALGKGGEEK